MMRLRNRIIPLIFLLASFAGYGQSKDEEIKKLQNQLKETELRATRAEQALQVANDRLTRLRFQAIAKALAEKSLDVEDKDQVGLLAMASLQFMKKGAGYEFDTDIYRGLLNAYKKYHPSLISIGANTEIGKIIKERDNIIYTSDGGNQLISWKFSDGAWKREDLGKRMPGKITAFDIEPTGNRILVGCEVNKKFSLYLYENPFNDPAKLIFKGNGSIDQIKIIPDGSGFYVLCNGGAQVLFSNWNETKEVIQSNENLAAIELAQDGSQLVGISKSSYLLTWNTSNYSLNKIQISSSHTELTSLSHIRNNQIVLGDDKGTLKIFRLSSNSTWRELVGHKAAVRSIAFSSSGKFMASASDDRTVRIWNMQELNRMPVIIKLDYVPNTVSFSDDDKQLLINSTQDGSKFTLEAMPIDFNKISSELCKLTGRNFTQDEWEIFIGADLPYEKVCPDNSN